MEFLKKAWSLILDFLKSVWFLFINVGYLVLILLVSYILFTVPAQTDDFIYVFVQDLDIAYIAGVYITLFMWCIVTWYSACINLQIDPIKGSLDRRERRLHVQLKLLIPRLLGVVPCLILACAIYSVDHVTEDNHRTLHLILSSGLAVLLLMIFTVIDKNADRSSSQGKKMANANFDYTKCTEKFSVFIANIFKPRLSNWPTWEEVRCFKRRTGYDPTFAQEWVFISQFFGVWFYYVILGAFFLLITILLSIPPVIFWFSQILRPGAILILSLASFTILFTIIAYFHDYTRRPFGFLVLFAIIFFSYFNDNTAIPTIKNDNVSKRQEVRKFFDGWLKDKKANWSGSTHHSKMPVIFIATQGGGIRGLTWTTRSFITSTLHTTDFSITLS